MEILKSASKISLLLIVFAIIVLTWLSIEVTEPLKTIAIMITSFYFGNKTWNGKQS